MAVSDGARKTVVFPFELGETVYHRASPERLKGIVTGYLYRKDCLRALVTWGDTLHGEATHQVFELTTEFEPNFNTES
jgi:hypothetical protein